MTFYDEEERKFKAMVGWVITIALAVWVGLSILIYHYIRTH